MTSEARKLAQIEIANNLVSLENAGLTSSEKVCLIDMIFRGLNSNVANLVRQVALAQVLMIEKLKAKMSSEFTRTKKLYGEASDILRREIEWNQCKIARSSDIYEPTREEIEEVFRC